MQSLSPAPASSKASLVEQQASVLIIYTGGTIGMQPGSDGSLKPCKGFLTDMIPRMDELTRPGMPHATVLEFDELLDSSDMGPDDWVKIAATIHKHYYDYDGFVCIHGTPTPSVTTDFAY